jgi:hypothetical protein
VVRRNSVRTACPWRIPNSTLYEAGNLQATIEAGFTTVHSLGAAIDKDVRDAIDAGAIPGPRLLTSIHQTTEKSGAPAKLREIVRLTKAEGGDVIKIFATESVRDGGKQTMTNEQIAAVRGEAVVTGIAAKVRGEQHSPGRIASIRP